MTSLGLRYRIQNLAFPLLVFTLALLLAGVSVYAWNTFLQHKTNELFGGAPYPTTIVLNKSVAGEGSIGRTPIPDTEFYLYRVEGRGTSNERNVQVGAQYLTDSQGQIVIDSLAPGYYFFEETRPAYGYTFARDASDTPITRYYFEVDQPSLSSPITVVVEAYNEPIAADLEITKQVENGDGSALTDEQSSEEFHFTVTFSESGSFPLLIDGVETGEITSGDTITLTHGQHARILGLKATTSYRIQELFYGGAYSIFSTNSSGTITEEGTVAEFVNIYGTPLRSTLILAKELEAGASTGTAFTFEVTFSDGGAYQFMRDGSQDAESLSAEGTLTLQAGERVTFIDVPVGVMYQIKEIASEGFTPTFDVVNGIVLRDGSQATFINTEDSEHTGDEDGELIISKEVTGTPPPGPAAEFTFVVMFDEDGEYTYTVDGEEYTVSNEETITLTAGQSAHFANLPKGLTYHIEELPLHGYRAWVTSYSGRIISAATTDLTFVNESTFFEGTQSELLLTKRVDVATDKRFTFDIYVNGALATTVEIGAGETASIQIPYGSAYEVVERDLEGFEKTLLENGSGTADSETIEITQHNRSTDVPLIEVSGDKVWVTSANPDAIIPDSITIDIYDGDLVVRTVEVTNDMQWHFSEMLPSLHLDGTPVNYVIKERPIEGFYTRIDGTTMTNTAYAPVQATIDTEKRIVVVAGDPKTTAPFSFTLVPLDGAPVPVQPTATINGEGAGSFDPITFISPGAYRYIVQEVPGRLAGYTYDATSYSVTVLVEDRGGQLVVTSISYTAPGTEPLARALFTNTYDDSLIITDTTKLDVTKEWKKDRAADRPAYISVDLIKDQEVYASATLSPKTGWSYTFEGLDPTATYVLKERVVPGGYTVSYSKYGTYDFVVTNTGSVQDTPTPKTGTSGSDSAKTVDELLPIWLSLLFLTSSAIITCLYLLRPARKR